MGLVEWFARRKLRPEVEDAKRWAAGESAKAAKDLEGSGMNDVSKVKVILHGFAAAVAAGAVTAIGDWMQNGMEFSRTGVYRALGAVVIGGLGAGGLYIKGLLSEAPTKTDAPKG